MMGMGLQAEYAQLAQEYAQVVRDFFGSRLVSICFFGSVVTGTATPESDIDVLIVAESMPMDLGLRVRESAPIHEKLRLSETYHKLRMQGRNAFVSEIFLTPDEAKGHPPILLDLTDEAFVAYDKNDFLKAVLEEMRRNLKALGAKKVKARKGHYWVLKPDAEAGEVVEI
jgi:predicted nucleotidyltransferase